MTACLEGQRGALEALAAPRLAEARTVAEELDRHRLPRTQVGGAEDAGRVAGVDQLVEGIALGDPQQIVHEGPGEAGADVTPDGARRRAAPASAVGRRGPGELGGRGLGAAAAAQGAT